MYCLSGLFNQNCILDIKHDTYHRVEEGEICNCKRIEKRKKRMKQTRNYCNGVSR